MFSRTVLLSLVLITAVLVGGVCSQTLKLTQMSEVRLSGLPAVNWPYHIDGTDEVIGIISDNGQWFTLYDMHGEAIFTKRSIQGYLASVKISPYDSVIVLADRRGDETHYYTVYDYSGNKILDTARTGTLAASPTGKFFFTPYELESSPGRPYIFGHDGQLLARYDRTSPYWDMRAIGDTMLLYQDGPIVMTIRIPELTVDTVMKVDNVNRPMYPASAISPDGTHYAFSGRNKIAICDLDENEVLCVDKPRRDDWPLNPGFLLAPGGEYLVLFWNPAIGTHQVQVWKRESDRYVMTAEKTPLPFDIGVTGPIRSQVISDDFCAVNCYQYRPTYTYRSYLFDYRHAKGDKLSGTVLKGYTSLSPHSRNEIRLLEVDADTTGSYTLKRFRVDIEDEN